MRKLFEQRAFWIVLSVLCIGLGVLALRRGERDFAIIYLVFLAFTVARAAGWRMPRI